MNNIKNKEYYNIYRWISSKFPNGNVGTDNVIPIIIDDNNMDLIIFTPYTHLTKPNYVSFGLFLSNARYARKTITINELGEIKTDDEGVIPDFDLTDDEPNITSSDEEIVNIAMDKLKSIYDY